MTHISSIGAGLYTDLSIAVPSTDPNFSTLTSASAWQALFATEITASGTAAANTFIRIQNVREFPSIGTPANIVNVPVYGSKTSRQVQGQADAPTIEITLNFVPGDWSSTTLGNTVGNGKQYGFRFTLLNTQPTGYASSSAGLGTVPGGAAGSCQNSQWYWYGKMEALQINPQLTDANTATLTVSVQSDFYGAYTS